MKKIAFLLLLTVTSLTCTWAQSGRQGKLTEEQRAELRAKMDDYKASLNLSEDQEGKVEKINMDYLEQLSGLKESPGTRLSKYKAFKQFSSDRDKKMKQVLTEEQYKIFKTRQEEFRDEVKARRKG